MPLIPWMQPVQWGTLKIIGQMETAQYKRTPLKIPTRLEATCTAISLSTDTLQKIEKFKGILQ